MSWFCGVCEYVCGVNVGVVVESMCCGCAYVISWVCVLFGVCVCVWCVRKYECYVWVVFVCLSVGSCLSVCLLCVFFEWVCVCLKD